MKDNLIKIELATGGNIYLDELAWQCYTGAGVSRDINTNEIRHTIDFVNKDMDNGNE